MEYKNKGKTEGTKQQQNHRTQEWTNRYQRERDWGDEWVGKDKGEEKKGGIKICMHGGVGERGGLYNTEKTSSDSTTFCYADGQ